jgi:hypothetical protein
MVQMLSSKQQLNSCTVGFVLELARVPIRILPLTQQLKKTAPKY